MKFPDGLWISINAFGIVSLLAVIGLIVPAMVSASNTFAVAGGLMLAVACAATIVVCFREIFLALVSMFNPQKKESEK